MRVILLNPFDAYAGSQRIGAELVAIMSKFADLSVRLGFGGKGFLSDLSGVSPDIRCDIISVRKLLYPFWTLAVAVPLVLSALRGRIIWANTVYAVPPAILALAFCPRGVIVHLHEATFPRIFLRLLRFAIWRGVRIVCVSQDQSERIGLPAFILPNPVSLPQHELSSKRDRLLFVGTTQPIKGFALFVATCEQIHELPLRKTAYLSDAARYDAVLVDAAYAAGIEIVFGESRPDILYGDGFLLFQTTDCTLWIETFSLVAVEAMARLVPVAGAGTAVLSEVLGNALAFDIPSRNAEEAAQAIVRLYADRDRQDALRAACAARRQNFSESLFTERLLAILQR